MYHLDAKITENRQSNMLKLCAKVSRPYARFHDSESRLYGAGRCQEAALLVLRGAALEVLKSDSDD